jgi:RHS repeat-associated protein
MTTFNVCASGYTGKERDAESGNDYFDARYYGSSMGRFISPDPSGILLADLTNPQSLNLCLAKIPSGAKRA